MPAGQAVRPALRPTEDVEPETAAIQERRVDLSDAVALVGLVLVVAGVAMIYRPAAFIVLGLALLLAAARS